jgi:hypothetical protein
MTERVALILTFLAMMAVLAIAAGLLQMIGASSEAFVLAFLIVLCGNSYALSRVVVHYRSGRT